MKEGKSLLVIDPGAKGAVVVYDGSTHQITLTKMPKGCDAFRDLIEAWWISGPPPVAFIENVGKHRKGNSGSATATFAGHVGELHGVLSGMHIPRHKLTASTWQSALFGDTLKKAPKPTGNEAADRKAQAKAKLERKHQIRERMAAEYPQFKVTLVNADALAMLTYVLRAEAWRNIIEQANA